MYVYVYVYIYTYLNSCYYLKFSKQEISDEKFLNIQTLTMKSSEPNICITKDTCI